MRSGFVLDVAEDSLTLAYCNSRGRQQLVCRGAGNTNDSLHRLTDVCVLRHRAAGCGMGVREEGEDDGGC